MPYSIPDHPAIRNAERTGYPDGNEPQYPICPVCGDECDMVYMDREKNIVGCNACLSDYDAWETEECFPERNYDG